VRFSLPLVPLGASQWALRMQDRIVLDKYVDVAAIGVYAMAYRLASPLQILTQAGLRTIQPVLSQAAADPARKPAARHGIGQYLGIAFPVALLGMLLPGVIYVTFLERGTDIRGLAVAAALANAMTTQAGAIFGSIIAIVGVWLLLKTQLDLLEGMVRGITDILWTGSKRVRSWRGGDVRLVYYGVLGVVTAWGLIAFRLAQPVVLLQLGAQMAAIVFVISSIHLLYINTRLLPVELRPPMWRRVCLVVMSLFYLTFVALWLKSVIAPAA
jgi:hypothetical protein